MADKPRLRDRLLGNPQAVTDHKTAKRNLHTNHDTEETDKYLDLNDAVIDTEQRVPWWRR